MTTEDISEQLAILNAKIDRLTTLVDQIEDYLPLIEETIDGLASNPMLKMLGLGK